MQYSARHRARTWGRAAVFALLALAAAYWGVGVVHLVSTRWPNL